MELRGGCSDDLSHRLTMQEGGWGQPVCSHRETTHTKLKINASFTSKILIEVGFVLAYSSFSHCSHGHLTAVCPCFHDIGHSTCHSETSTGHTIKMVFQLLFKKIMIVV